MNKQDNFDNLLKILKILKPEFYNKLTWLVAISGIAILTSSITDRLLNAFFELNFDLSLTDGNDSLIGFGLVLAALVYHSFGRWLDWYSQLQYGNNELEKDLQHDKEIFQMTDSLLDERTIKEILNWIATDHSYEKDQISALDNYHFKAAEDGNAYINSDLEKARVHLLTKIGDVRRFVSYNFFVHPSGQDPIHRFCLYPELNWDRGGAPSPEQETIYNTKADEMLKHIEEAECAYGEFRVLIKRILRV